MNLLRLPNELLLEIAKYLPIEPLASLWRVNNRLKGLLEPCLIKHESAIHWSAIHGVVWLMRSVLKTGSVDVNTPDAESGQTALALAVNSQSQAIVTMLMADGRTDINTTDNNQQTPLLHAIRQQNLPITQLLTGDNRVDVNHGFPLLRAMRTKYSDGARCLLKRQDVNMSATDGHEATALHYMAAQNVIDLIQLFLANPDTDINALDVENKTPLDYAIRQGSTAAVSELLRHDKMELDIKLYIEDYLILAVKKGQSDLLSVWIKYAIPTFSKNGDQATIMNAVYNAVTCAIDNGNAYATWALLSAYANYRGYRNGTLLMSAAKSSQGAIMLDLLLKLGDQVDPNLQDEDGNTALHHAVEQGNMGAVNRLIREHCLDVNVQSKNWMTPLGVAICLRRDAIAKALLARSDCQLHSHYPALVVAASDNRVNWIRYLLRQHPNRVNVNSRSYFEGSTALCVAAMNNNYDSVNLLLRTPGVNVNLPDQQGRTPLWWAAHHGNVHIARLLTEHWDISREAADSTGITPFAIAKQNFLEMASTLDPSRKNDIG